MLFTNNLLVTVSLIKLVVKNTNMLELSTMGETFRNSRLFPGSLVLTFLKMRFSAYAMHIFAIAWSIFSVNLLPYDC